MTIRVSASLADLTGTGCEVYIRPDGFMIEFVDGKFRGPSPKGNLEDTVIC